MDLRDPDSAMIDEERRLATLHALALQGVAVEQEFDSLVALAAEMLDCPIAALTLIDRDRAWVKAGAGIEPQEVDREVAICNHTIRGPDALVVPDLTFDERFAANPHVVDGGLRFYAGMPIHAEDEAGTPQPIGALCVVDHHPRSLSTPGRRALAHLTALAEALIAARGTAVRALAMAELSERQAVDLRRQDRSFRQAERLAEIGSWRLTLADNRVNWSDGVFHIHGLPPGAMPTVDEALLYYPPHARDELDAALAHCVETGEPFDCETDFLTADRQSRRVRSVGEREEVDGVPVALVGVFQDVTDRYRLETTLRRSAETDVLTGLANRAAFERTLAASITRAERAGTPLLLALVDLDGFKAINDTLGHLAGDDVLKAVGRALREPWLASSCVARLGGDEFAVVVEDPRLIVDQAALVARLEAALRQPVRGSGNLTLQSAGTVGAALLEPRMSGRDLVHAADLVLYAAKRRRVGEGLIRERRRAA